MVLLGIVLLLVAALAIVSAVFTAEVSGGQVEFLGVEVGSVGLFLIGLGSGLAIWWGFWLFTSGSKRSWARRKEKRRLTELSAKLDKVEAERRQDVDHQEEQDRPTL